MTTSIRFNAHATVLTLLLAVPMFGQVSDGDRSYDQRAAGANGAQAKAEPIDAAISSYQRAIAQNGNDLVAHGRLLRAYRFKGAYVARTNDEKKQVYTVAKAAGDKALAAVGRALKAKGVGPDAAEKTVAPAIRGLAGAGEVFLWDAINWGEWALAYGKMAAARQGAADRIRRGATIAHLADPGLDLGAPARVLGRLHSQTPRIPFITGWASSKLAVSFLEESLKRDPGNKLTMVFLAEALMDHDAATRPRAVQLLKSVISAPTNSEYQVEDAAAVEDAKVVLRKLQG